MAITKKENLNKMRWVWWSAVLINVFQWSPVGHNRYSNCGAYYFRLMNFTFSKISHYCFNIKFCLAKKDEEGGERGGWKGGVEGNMVPWLSLSARHNFRIHSDTPDTPNSLPACHSFMATISQFLLFIILSCTHFRFQKLNIPSIFFL